MDSCYYWYVLLDPALILSFSIPNSQMWMSVHPARVTRAVRGPHAPIASALTHAHAKVASSMSPRTPLFQGGLAVVRIPILLILQKCILLIILLNVLTLVKDL